MKGREMQPHNTKFDNKSDLQDAAKRVPSECSVVSSALLYDFVKRCFDIVLSLGAGLFLSAPMLILCIVIMIKSFGNPFYVQTRMGKDGKEFSMVKLRSMKKGADNLEKMLNDRQLKKYLKEYKLEDDPRLIGWRKPGDGHRCFGAFIRQTSLDELPQIFWNILIKGNMSIVGPRPILREELEQNYTIEEQRRLLSIKPGLTGYWQVYARNNATYQTGERQQMELYYVNNRNMWLDIRILCATVGAVLRKTGAN